MAFSSTGIEMIQMLRSRRIRRGEIVREFDRAMAVLPSEAIAASAELLAFLIEHYGRDGGITAYNSGSTGGRAVARLGFWRARRAGKLRRAGIYHLQGHRFLLNVLNKANVLRRASGLGPLPGPGEQLAAGAPTLAVAGQSKTRLLAQVDGDQQHEDRERATEAPPARSRKPAARSD